MVCGVVDGADQATGPCRGLAQPRPGPGPLGRESPVQDVEFCTRAVEIRARAGEIRAQAAEMRIQLERRVPGRESPV
ncbi:hypothetical protein BAY61_26940 [Prauserella marina]|nr:hypothetical protein BAY61_26940 [Prauserella marina]